ncbi:hypothetical protein EXIGLDRAFT_714809 [Exidia glandulosa HHB12029]|uniref:GST N-terminal domain-containing protein n=1 Tax=Exidia glandulosa HHB12029 TaxID=1314781 RepID=A0A165B2Y7_EXIGL|nr:hypothetical protein EXIGLDRAFT_714809 [Exidia glandulosa HHB12029]
MITLYDITSTLDPPCWSPNVWKIRLLLNYKQVPYTTKWISYPDIESTCLDLGAAPTSTRPWDGQAFYTLPVIEDDARHPGVISDSSSIAEYIESNYPTPSVLPSSSRTLQACFVSYLATNLLPALRPLVIPAVHRILDQRGQEYYRRTREPQFGVALEKILPYGSAAREEQWMKIAGVLDKIAGWFDENEGAESPVYADFVLAAYLLWLVKRSGANQDGWATGRVRDWNDGRWAKIVKNCAPYMTVV